MHKFVHKNQFKIKWRPHRLTVSSYFGFFMKKPSIYYERNALPLEMIKHVTHMLYNYSRKAAFTFGPPKTMKTIG